VQVSRVQTPVTSSSTVAQSGPSLSGGTVTVNNMTQSGVVNVGGGGCSTPQQQSTVIAKQNSLVQQSASPASAPVQQMMSVQIPVTNASGQTVYQTIQVPLPSQPAANAPLTMYNLFPQQTITLSSPATSGSACDGQTSAGSSAAQMIASADGSVKFITMPSPQTQQQTQQVFSAVTPGAAMAGSNAGVVGNSPLAMVMAVPQQSASVQQAAAAAAGGIIQTPSGGGTVLLSNGQVRMIYSTMVRTM